METIEERSHTNETYEKVMGFEVGIGIYMCFIVAVIGLYSIRLALSCWTHSSICCRILIVKILFALNTKQQPRCVPIRYPFKIWACICYHTTCHPTINCLYPSRDQVLDKKISFCICRDTLFVDIHSCRFC